MINPNSSPRGCDEKNGEGASASSPFLFTPGPWLHLGQGDIVQQASVSLEYLTDVASVYQTRDGTTGDANARLIAAAPDLLASLLEALPLIHGHQETPHRRERYERAAAAIAKATGGR
jgi:hypothetical protein